MKRRHWKKGTTHDTEQFISWSISYMNLLYNQHANSYVMLKCDLFFSSSSFADIDWEVNQRNKRLTWFSIMTVRIFQSSTEWWHYHSPLFNASISLSLFSLLLFSCQQFKLIFFSKIADSTKTTKIHNKKIESERGRKKEFSYNANKRTITVACCSNQLIKF